MSNKQWKILCKRLLILAFINLAVLIAIVLSQQHGGKILLFSRPIAVGIVVIASYFIFKGFPIYDCPLATDATDATEEIKRLRKERRTLSKIASKFGKCDSCGGTVLFMSDGETMCCCHSVNELENIKGTL